MYIVQMAPRHYGKTAYAIDRALRHGGPILVTREETKRRVLEAAQLMGVEAPEVIVYTPKQKLTDIAPAVAIIDIYDEPQRTGGDDMPNDTFYRKGAEDAKNRILDSLAGMAAVLLGVQRATVTDAIDLIKQMEVGK